MKTKRRVLILKNELTETEYIHKRFSCIKKRSKELAFPIYSVVWEEGKKIEIIGKHFVPNFEKYQDCRLVV